MVELVADGTVESLKLEDFLPYRLMVLSALVDSALMRLYARHHLSTNEWFVLMTLGQFGVMTAKAIGTRNRMHKTKVSRIVALLLERNLVSRRVNPADLRQTFLLLTPSGRALYEESAQVAAGFVQHLEDSLQQSDREVLDRCLARLAVRSEQLISGRRG